MSLRVHGQVAVAVAVKVHVPDYDYVDASQPPKARSIACASAGTCAGASSVKCVPAIG